MKKGDVIRQKCVNNTFYLTGIWAHKVNNITYWSTLLWYLIKLHIPEKMSDKMLLDREGSKARNQITIFCFRNLCCTGLPVPREKC